ncbi:MAG TPA: 2-C-methyl-D-erythritol 2,4-cyclodiphosphate synthase [Vicinamibacteria bacterium]|nr:2-C-methyl-D-erythritol 2,4-cyclodiphosphate synthase [Vicinamibacteria bacterium]
MRIGHGFDAHRLVAGRPLHLGGIEVPHGRGLEGHSDGDCVLHAVCDALLGAAGEGDMGKHFPSRDPRWRGVASRVFLEEVRLLLAGAGCALVNLDVTVVAQEPELAPHLEAMREAIAGVLGVETEQVSVKAKSTDRLGALGRGEGVAALATALLEKRR